MKMLNCMHAMILMMMITMLGAFWANAQVQGNNGGGSTCVNQLVPCLSYLNNQQQGRDPPDSCCDPLKSVIKSNPECLCSMISNQGTKNAERAGINVTQAQELPARCGQRVNPISCVTTTSKNTPGSSDSQQIRCFNIYLFMLVAALYCWFM
ncbi:putative plant non-specific lipid-transfer protein/Par allergen [Helianthus annuus]|nr:putative plant non-specific lipid-transfer protein/Par allergen [Helianthus annuus]